MAASTSGSVPPQKQGEVHFGDCFEKFSEVSDNTVDAIITDPPYFLDGMGDTWGDDMVKRQRKDGEVIRSLRPGMRFDPKQGKDFQEFMGKVSKEAYRVLKPGGWMLSFSAPRLYHRLGVAMEDEGFEIRDMFEWLYTMHQTKAMSVVRSMRNDDLSSLTEEEVRRLEEELTVWKTPQVKSCFEPICVGQKPREGTFYNNWKQHHIGLVRIKHSPEDGQEKITSNVITTEHLTELHDKTFLVGKPTRKEKGTTTHASVKPLLLMRHLVKIFVPEGGLVLDPFSGSGSTGIAALQEQRHYLGFDNNPVYLQESRERFLKQWQVQESPTGYTILSTRNNATLLDL